MKIHDILSHTENEMDILLQVMYIQYFVIYTLYLVMDILEFCDDSATCRGCL